MDGPPCTSQRLPAYREIRRVKTGCYTCKGRKVKCDEQRPSCLRCISTGRKCSGYGVWGGGATPRLEIYQPSNLGPLRCLNAQDRCILEWFMRAKFEGIFPFPFWESLIPQACYSEPVILNCVLALGAAHQRACIDMEPIDPQRIDDNLESSTLKYYNVAISSLTRFWRGVSQLDGSRAHTRVTLIACLAFIIIEYLQKHPVQGLRHLQHGLRILRNPTYSSVRQSSRDPIDDWLAEAFGRLDIQARPLLSITTDDQACPSVCEDGGRLLVLSSLHEARQHLDRLISQAYQLQHLGSNAESSVDTSLLFHALSVQQRLQRDLCSWLQAYRTWQARTASSHQAPLSPPEQIARRLLLVYHTMANIMTATALYVRDESVFDHHIPQFASIIAAADELLETYKPCTSRRAAPHGHCSQYFTFTSDLGLIPVLYYTVIKCRDIQLRRSALSLLATKTHQEGIWEGSTAALIAAEVVRLETPCPRKAQEPEQGASRTFSPNSSFPPLWRISDITVELPDGPGAEILLTCKRKLGSDTWDVIERRYSRDSQAAATDSW
ncbi:C6 zinc finger domain-containing protein [Fusarium pseudoanthophilum]|uniref:C6 zinc finger domain-containing protein n=1 Tax=Fusarium pseudoanthophilum TaxID=48495 RepID=A0A8H5LBZ3_9HYPO|nr:C6 zinc finger domain-containing protein [Fusarium pseudoanthophilum]